MPRPTELTRCNNCMNVFEEEELELIKDGDGFFPACPKCKTDEYLMDLNN